MLAISTPTFLDTITRNLRRRWAGPLSRAQRRIPQALRLAAGRLRPEDARDLYPSIAEISGWLPLETLSADSVAESFRYRFGDHPKAAEWAKRAVSRVAHNRSSSGDAHNGAIHWALDLCRDYAKEEGVILSDPAPEPYCL